VGHYVLDSSYTEYKIRLSGIDAPERGQPYGTASRDHLASMVAGKEVLVDWYKQDKYGRIVGKVWVQPADCPTCGRTLDVSLAQVTCTSSLAIQLSVTSGCTVSLATDCSLAPRIQPC